MALVAKPELPGVHRPQERLAESELQGWEWERSTTGKPEARWAQQPVIENFQIRAVGLRSPLACTRPVLRTLREPQELVLQADERVGWHHCRSRLPHALPLAREQELPPASMGRSAVPTGNPMRASAVQEPRMSSAEASR